MKHLIQFAMAALLCALAFGQDRPEVPDSLKAPDGEKVLLHAHAAGVQIYVCKVDSDQGASWVLKAPEAKLTDATGKTIIYHAAGPSWKHIDGSEVIGKVVAKQDAPKPGAIPWLLLSAASHTGAGNGIMLRVTTIQRVYTSGGLAPEANECTASAKDNESRVPYTADYYFYAPTRK